MKDSLAIVGMLTLLTLSGCFNPDDNVCQTHCYAELGNFQASPLDADLSPSNTELSCVDGTVADDVILLNNITKLTQANFRGETCAQTQTIYEQVSNVIGAEETGSSVFQPAADIAAYNTFTASLALDLRNDCVSRLTAEDIDEDTIGAQTCEFNSAITVCNAYVMYPALARFELGSPNFEAPAESTPGTKHIGDDETCDYLPSGLGGSGGGDESGAVDSGGDSSTGAGVNPPFGDIGALVSCNRGQTKCAYDPEVVANLSASFAVFYREGVTLQLLEETDTDYPGVRLGGLDRGEESTDLADAFGLRNGDVVRNVGGIGLKDESTAMAATQELIAGKYTTLEIVRNEKSRSLLVYPKK